MFDTNACPSANGQRLWIRANKHMKKQCLIIYWPGWPTTNSADIFDFLLRFWAFPSHLLYQFVHQNQRPPPLCGHKIKAWSVFSVYIYIDIYPLPTATSLTRPAVTLLRYKLVFYQPLFVIYFGPLYCPPPFLSFIRK